MRGMDIASESFFARPATDVARELIGAGLLVEDVGGRVVETEAYAPTEPASHSFRGPTKRNSSMFAAPGTAYVYRSYGLHWCFNVVCETGSAVLIRALEPLWGIAQMEARRGTRAHRLLCSGPGKLTSALGITGALDGLPLGRPPIRWLRAELRNLEVVTGPRIGISKATELPWRYGLANSPFISRPFPKERS